MEGYSTKTFKEIFATSDDFTTYFNSSAFSGSVSNLALIYALIYAKYANSHIVGSDEEQWKMRLCSHIYSYGPTWEKKVDIQKTLREMSESDLILNGKMISKSGYNPSTIAEDGPNPEYEEISTVDTQNTSRTITGKVNAYANLWSLLKTDITTSFINSFKNLFITIILPGAINDAIIPVPEEEINAIYDAINSLSADVDGKVSKTSVSRTSDETELVIDTYQEV